MVHTVKRFTNPLIDSTLEKVLYVLEAFSPSLKDNSFLNTIKGVPNKIKELHKLASKARSPVLPHVHQYMLYHKALLKNIKHITLYLENKNIILLSPFATTITGKHPVYQNQLRIKQRVSVGPKKGHDLFSSSNSFADIIMNLESNLFHKEDSNNIFILISPILQFGEYNHEKGCLYNAVNKVSGINLIENVNSELFARKKELIKGQTLEEGLNDDFCYLSPMLYDSKLAKEFLSESKEEDEQIILRTSYLRLITSIMFADLLKDLPISSLYFHGEKNSSAYKILNNISKFSNKAIYLTKTMENPKVSTYGAADIAAEQKLGGQMIFNKYLQKEKTNLTIDTFFKEPRFEGLFD